MVKVWIRVSFSLRVGVMARTAILSLRISQRRSDDAVESAGLLIATEKYCSGAEWLILTLRSTPKFF